VVEHYKDITKSSKPHGLPHPQDAPCFAISAHLYSLRDRQDLGPLATTIEWHGFDSYGALLQEQGLHAHPFRVSITPTGKCLVLPHLQRFDALVLAGRIVVLRDRLAQKDLCTFSCFQDGVVSSAVLAPNAQILAVVGFPRLGGSEVALFDVSQLCQDAAKSVQLLAPNQLQLLWTDLASADTTLAAQAMTRMLQYDKAIPLALKVLVQPVKVPATRQLRDSLQNL
jgi:hypothetical protein